MNCPQDWGNFENFFLNIHKDKYIVNLQYMSIYSTVNSRLDTIINVTSFPSREVSSL